MTQTMWIPIKFPSLNDYIGAMNRHRYIGNSMKQEFTQAAAWLAKSQLLAVGHPVIVKLQWQEANRNRDPDNIVFAKKFILDGLVMAGILPNDTQRYVLGFEETILINPNPGVMVTLIERIKQ